MKKVMFLLFSVMVLIFTGCTSDRDVPNHLLFEGESKHWRGEVEIKQSKSDSATGKYNFAQRQYAECLGDDVEQLEQSNDIDINWTLSGMTDIDNETYISKFQREIGHIGVDDMDSALKSNVNTFYVEEDANLKMVIKWGENEETIQLELIDSE
ncbi:hypothetical protein LGQ02_11355 [Bacillus shivajii]|uniref:hypothetical protein n=1 Tax=Bacillus shivajii TaxID=1983719 RepID=UPI001CFBD46F|nr:hypothetical protein [Bacillus shivajii]UCZ51474.1 hypothetical protein LGQ02_11355 [Bacillus shivajii]